MLVRGEAEEQRTTPLDWIALAFKCYREGGFEVEAGETAGLLASA